MTSNSTEVAAAVTALQESFTVEPGPGETSDALYRAAADAAVSTMRDTDPSRTHIAVVAALESAVCVPTDDGETAEELYRAAANNVIAAVTTSR